MAALGASPCLCAGHINPCGPREPKGTRERHNLAKIRATNQELHQAFCGLEEYEIKAEERWCPMK